MSAINRKQIRRILERDLRERHEATSVHSERFVYDFEGWLALRWEPAAAGDLQLAIEHWGLRQDPIPEGKRRGVVRKLVDTNGRSVHLGLLVSNKRISIEVSWSNDVIFKGDVPWGWDLPPRDWELRMAKLIQDTHKELAWFIRRRKAAHVELERRRMEAER